MATFSPSTQHLVDDPEGTGPTGSAGPTKDTEGLRLRLTGTTDADGLDGAWWPRSRDLQVEASDLIDHFPAGAGRINRLLFSRPDWDDCVTADGRGVRTVRAARGPVKVGSFPRDDTHEVVLSMAGGTRMRLRVVPAAADASTAARHMS